MLLVAIAYYLLSVGSGLPGLRLTVGFAGVQSFPANSMFHRFGVVSAPGAVHGWFLAAEKSQLFKTSIITTNL
ncbi:hypothetical protein [Ruminococcus sp. AF31-8BH]|uniref:hypothetical protein n=1 Tax=Ruminococcus sp. AF31-8BH TaxID=2293174 RepID=UPI001A9A4E67|nr:hypothetical protein [Ruminococcus sp. AF31-8BH]